MQYDYERAAAIINAFRDLVMEIKSIDNACQTEIKEADMAFCDIRQKTPAEAKYIRRGCFLNCLKEWSDKSNYAYQYKSYVSND